MEEKVLDASGLACPMPLIKAREEMNNLQVGQVLKVLSTDRGSIKDFQGWAKTAKNIEILKQETLNQNGKEIFVHYIKKTS
jgi:tRNA 2-thiouridine synthesizing protein A